MDPFSKRNARNECHRPPLSFPAGLMCNRCVFKNLWKIDEKSPRFLPTNLESWQYRRRMIAAFSTRQHPWIFTSRTSNAHNFFNMAPFSKRNARNECHRPPLSFLAGLVCNRCVFKNLWKLTKRRPDFCRPIWNPGISTTNDCCF